MIRSTLTVTPLASTRSASPTLSPLATLHLGRCWRSCWVAIAFASMQTVVVATTSPAKMVVVSLLTCWEDPSLDPKLGSSELLPLPSLVRQRSGPFVALHLHWLRCSCRATSLYIYVSANTTPNLGRLIKHLTQAPRWVEHIEHLCITQKPRFSISTAGRAKGVWEGEQS